MTMPEPLQLLRVVALRKGKLKPVEFRLRPGEHGLSLFRLVNSETPDRVLEAVRLMGKTGDLAAAVIDSQSFLRENAHGGCCFVTAG